MVPGMDQGEWGQGFMLLRVPVHILGETVSPFVKEEEERVKRGELVMGEMAWVSDVIAF